MDPSIDYVKLWKKELTSKHPNIHKIASYIPYVDINRQTKKGNTALILASGKLGNTDLVNLLIHAGAELNIQNEIGESALIVACKNGYDDIAIPLIHAGANVNLRDENGDTALIHASQIKKESAGNKYIVDALIDANADLNVKNINGDTALFNSIQDPYTYTIAEAIINAGADLNIKNRRGNTILMEVSFIGNMPLVLAIINKGVDVNLQNREGNTALHLASMKGRIDVVHYLLSVGADKSIKNRQNNTARDVAKKVEIIELLDEDLDAMPPNYILSANNATNAITYDPIQNGNRIVNFHNEFEHKRYYKQSSFNEFIKPRMENPFTRERISRIKKYTARISGGKRRRTRRI